MAIKIRTILMERPEMGDMGIKGKRSGRWEKFMEKCFNGWRKRVSIFIEI